MLYTEQFGLQDCSGLLQIESHTLYNCIVRFFNFEGPSKKSIIDHVFSGKWLKLQGATFYTNTCTEWLWVLIFS